MSPPQLPGNAPIPDVVHPFVIGLGPVFRNDLGFGRFPLPEWLCPPVASSSRTIAWRLGVPPWSCYDRTGTHSRCNLPPFPAIPLLPSLLQRASARCKSVQPSVRAGCRRHAAMLINYLDARKVVALAGFEIVRIVSRGDFHDAGAELRVGDIVQNDRNFAIR